MEDSILIEEQVLVLMRLRKLMGANLILFQ